MTGLPLADRLTALAARHDVPGVGVGVLDRGSTTSTFTGVTSLANPLPTDAGTRFQIGSVSKTFTVTAVLRLVHDGRVALTDPVRRHVPELRLADEATARDVTVRDLLNHTAGWDGSQTSGVQTPDAPLSEFVATMAGLEQVRPLGVRAEYNNAAIALAGRLVERVTGARYEDALRALLLDPLGLRHTAFTTDDLMTERCTVGHVADDDGGRQVARPWRWPRAANPEGGLVSTIADQLTWARFHLGDGRGADGVRLLDADQLRAMQTPTVTLAGNAMGDAVGLGWWLRDVGGELTLSHAGTTNGQFAELRLVPARDYAVIVCANGAPGGTQFVRELVDDLLDADLGLRREEPPRRPYDPARDADLAGTYENGLSRLTLTVSDGTLRLGYALQPAAAVEFPGGAPTFAPCRLDLYDGERGEYVVGDGAFAGLTGSFARDASGAVVELDFGGRWHRRTAD